MPDTPHALANVLALETGGGTPPSARWYFQHKNMRAWFSTLASSRALTVCAIRLSSARQADGTNPPPWDGRQPWALYLFVGNDPPVWLGAYTTASDAMAHADKRFL